MSLCSSVISSSLLGFVQGVYARVEGRYKEDDSSCGAAAMILRVFLRGMGFIMLDMQDDMMSASSEVDRGDFTSANLLSTTLRLI